MHQMYQPHKSWKCERVGIHSFSVALLNQIKESTFLNDFFFFLKLLPPPSPPPPLPRKMDT